MRYTNLMRRWMQLCENDTGTVASYTPPTIDIGDEVLVGKFKNRKATVSGFTKDDHQQPVLKTTKGAQKLFKPRITKLDEVSGERGFKRWFGQSKVVDAHGAPLLVYHGTKDKSFTEFDPAKIKSGVGFWFTSDRSQALGHTTSIDRRGRAIHGRVIEAYLSIQNPATTIEDYIRGTDADGNPYDGYCRAEHQLYVAFRPDQIKIVNR